MAGLALHRAVLPAAVPRVAPRRGASPLDKPQTPCAGLGRWKQAFRTRLLFGFLNPLLTELMSLWFSHHLLYLCVLSLLVYLLP